MDHEQQAEHAAYIRKKTELMERLAGGTTKLTLAEVLFLRGMVIDVGEYERKLHQRRKLMQKRSALLFGIIKDLLAAMLVTAVGFGLLYVLFAYRIPLYVF